MPVNWDAAKDQFVLLQLIADKNLNINKTHYDNIIAAWPSTFGDPPTQRAISEHFVKLRAKLEKDGVEAPKTPAAKAQAKTNKKTPNTANKKTPASRSTNKKRKLNDNSDDDEIQAIKREDPDDGSAPGGDNDDSPSKRSTVPRRSLFRSTKSPDKRARVAEFINENLNDGTDVEDDDGSEVHPAAEEYDSAEDEMMA